jgi:predicted DNA-binding transcriptional regulator YafY
VDRPLVEIARPDHLAVAISAAARGARVHLEYINRDGVSSRRQVVLHTYDEDTAMLVGFCLRRGSFRTFALNSCLNLWEV